MKDNRNDVFNKLAEEIKDLISFDSGPELGQIAENALKILQNIVEILNSSPVYEHGLQRVADRQANLESARDDFRLSEHHLESLQENYRRLRMNSGAGKCKYFG